MTTYNTGNPVPSADARDRFDNSQSFDVAVNSSELSTVTRTGKVIKTLAGHAFDFEQSQVSRAIAFQASQASRAEAFKAFIDASGFSSLGTYAAGIQIVSHSQTVDYAGQPYSLKAEVPASVEAPYTVSGNWATESSNFKLVGDSSLRQNLADSTDPLLGAALLGRGMVAVASIKDLPTQKKDSSLVFFLQSFHEGFNIGGSPLIWSPTVLKSKHDGVRVFSPTVPVSGILRSDQTTITAYMNGSGETDASGSGCFLRVFTGAVCFEYAGVTAGVDCGLIAQKVLDLAVPDGLQTTCDVTLTHSTTLDIPTYRTQPAVQRDLNRSATTIRHLKPTMTAGVGVFMQSQIARLTIGWLDGPGYSGQPLVGAKALGQGGNVITISQINGFRTGFEFNESYSNTLSLGWVDDCIIGVDFVNSNANVIPHMHVGGRYSTGNPPIGLIDPTTCEIGVRVGAGCAGNDIQGTIEYCRRSSGSIGLLDNGAGTRFSGYTETCSGWNIYAEGKSGYYEVIAGGKTQRADSSGYYAGDTCHIHFKTQIDYYNQAPGSVGTEPLDFLALQKLVTSGTGIITGPNGFSTFIRNVHSARNVVKDSALLTGASWTTSATGGASWTGVATASNVSMADAGYLSSTQLVFPPLAADDAVYRKGQGELLMQGGPISFGYFALCTAGSVEVKIRIVKSDGTVQHTHNTMLGASSNFMKVGSTFTYSGADDSSATMEITFRSSEGATLYFVNPYLVNRAGALFPPMNLGVAVRPVLSGKEIDGNAVYNGLRVSGAVQGSCSELIGYSVSLGAESSEHRAYAFTGGTYSILLTPGLEGQFLDLYRDDVAAVVNIIPTGTVVNGSGSAIAFSAPRAQRHLQYITALGGWVGN